MEDKIMVSIQCLVYNHEPYLRQCLEGFVIQKTNFKFEAIVHDDCSTDNSAAIIREYAEKYPDIIKPIYESENQYSKHDGSLGRIMDSACKGEYIAFCEGDDFWTDILKLQKQFDALEEYPQATMCYTGFMCVTEEGQLYQREAYKKLMEKSFSGDNFIALLKGPNYPMTLTCMVRKNVFESPFYHEAIVRYDYGFFLTAASIGNFIFLPDRTACYRNSPNGLMNTQKNNIIEASVQTKLFFADCIISNKTKHVCFLGKIRVLLSIVDNHLSMRKSVSNKYFVAFLKRHKMLSLLYPVVLLKKCIMYNMNKI